MALFLVLIPIATVSVVDVAVSKKESGCKGLTVPKYATEELPQSSVNIPKTVCKEGSSPFEIAVNSNTSTELASAIEAMATAEAAGLDNANTKCMDRSPSAMPPSIIAGSSAVVHP